MSLEEQEQSFPPDHPFTLELRARLARALGTPDVPPDAEDTVE